MKPEQRSLEMKDQVSAAELVLVECLFSDED